MAKKARLKGIQDVVGGLNKEFRKIENATPKGLIESGNLIRRETDNITPIKFGNLRASWFMVLKGKGDVTMGKMTFKGKDAGRDRSDRTIAIANAQSLISAINRPTIALGFSARYAEAVHENMSPKIKWSKAGTGPKFFEIAVNSNRNQILALMQKSVKTK
jgi:hypothetical protein